MKYSAGYDGIWHMYCASCQRTVSHKSTLIVLVAGKLHHLLCYWWRGLTKDTDAAATYAACRTTTDRRSHVIS